jgi:hypothetical protein
MSSTKILSKQGVITLGSGQNRVVLDREACLGYAYHNPEKVLAYYEPFKGWIVTKRPYYSSGGWGNSSKGDSEGYHQSINMRELLRSVDATILELNSEDFFTNKQARELNKAIAKHNKLAKKQNALVSKITNRNVQVETLNRIVPFKLEPISKGKSLRGLDAIKTAKVFTDALQTFIKGSGKTVKVEAYTIKPNLVIQNFTNVAYSSNTNTDKITKGFKTVAFRDSQGNIYMNSELLTISDFERKFLGGQSLIQQNIRTISKYNIPFNVLDSAGLKLSETRVLEQGPESDHDIKVNTYGDKTEKRHFTGALLLENSGRKFLMDIDRNEIKFGIFNAFFVEVDSSVNTIEQAYDSMVPSVVKTAIKSGLDVKRQGEWFFIPTNETLTLTPDKVLNWDRDQKATKVFLKHNISHGKGRPNSLYKPVGYGALDNLVGGMVTHSGREHKDLDLGKTENTDGTETYKLWQVVGNTTVGNFTITGDID